MLLPFVFIHACAVVASVTPDGCSQAFFFCCCARSQGRCEYHSGRPCERRECWRPSPCLCFCTFVMSLEFVLMAIHITRRVRNSKGHTKEAWARQLSGVGCRGRSPARKEVKAG